MKGTKALSISQYHSTPINRKAQRRKSNTVEYWSSMCHKCLYLRYSRS